MQLDRAIDTAFEVLDKEALSEDKIYDETGYTTGYLFRKTGVK